MSDVSRNSEIVPAILTDDPAELDRLLTVLKDAGASRVHIDVIDGSLIEGRTVLGYRELAGRDLGIDLDIHLMVDDPVEHLIGWDRVDGIARVITHVEAHDTDIERLHADCASRNREYWAAINPDTPIERLPESGMDGAMFMTVVPGAQGRPFRDDVLERIRTWREQHDIPVMVDGGVTPTTAPQCAAAGANVFVVGSYAVRSDDPRAALHEVADAIR